MYDVFISFKNMDNNGNLTEDSLIAEKIYVELKNRGAEVFFSNHEIEEQGESRWRLSIDQALESADTLVLVGTSLANIQSPQVAYEWEQIFMEEIISRKKPDGRVIGYFKGIDRGACPQKLQNQELFDAEEKSIEKLCDFIERRLPQRNTVKPGADELKPEDTDLKSKYNKRFHYAAGYTKLVGRENEINFLKKFCFDTNSLLSWTIISGKGGLGKSKLANDFCSIIEKSGWTVFRPRHAKFFSKDRIASISADAVICFDYVKFEMEYVEEIIQFIIEQKIRHRIRIILIERDGAGVERGFSTKVSEYHYKEGDLKLAPIEEDALAALAHDYIESLDVNRKFTDCDINRIIEVLREVDPGVCRPLFAMFIADAWVDGNINLLNWDRDSAVKYIAGKELDRFNAVVSGYSNSVSDKNQNRNALYLAIVYATFVGEMSLDDMLDKLDVCIPVPVRIIRQMLADSEILRDDTVKGIEPDLVGECICINILSKLEESNVNTFFANLYENHFTEMIAYFDKIYDDYTDAFLESSWSKFATDVELPMSFNYVRNNMFNGCGFIHEIRLHSNITTIAKGAFRDCYHLKKINFPDNLEIIDSAAFVNCVELESAVPDDEKGWAPSIIYIGDRAFKNCRKLKEIRIPRSVKEIGTEAFAKCSSLEKVEIPREVTTIAHNTFELCTSLSAVILRDYKKEILIQSEAFRGCSNLKYLKNSRRISGIGKSAFENCGKLKGLSLSEKLTHILDSAFRGCISLEEMDLSNTELRVLNKSVFEGCENFEKIMLPESLSRIAARCFLGCQKLSSVILPQSITNIGELAFFGCSCLKCDSFGENFEKLKEFGAFYVNGIDDDFIEFVTSYYDKKDVRLPLNIYKVGDRAFQNDRNLEYIEIHDGITGLGKEAFNGCFNLKKITGSFAGIKTIGERAFAACRELESLPTDSLITEIAEAVFKNCISLKEVRINSEIQKIGRWAFYRCGSLQRLFFKGSCSYISAGAFSGCEKFYLSAKYHIKKKGRLYYLCGFIFNRLGRDELYFIRNYPDWDDVEIPKSCIGFFENPFEKTNAKRIYVPDSVRTLIKNNFSNAAYLESIRLPRHIDIIPQGAFEGCLSLRRIEMPDTADNDLKEGLRIGQGAFSGCVSLTHVGLPAGTDKLENAVFKNCRLLETVTFNKDLKVIGHSAFSGCETMKSVSIPESVEQIENAAFINCTGLESVFGLENTGIRTIHSETFRGCINLAHIKLPADLQSIGPFGFYDCRRLEKIEIFNTDISYIGIAAFQNCYMLQECILPRKVKKIEKFTFKSCTQLKRIKMAPDIEEIDTSAFFGCNMLNEMDLHNKRKLRLLGNDAFAGCHRLENMVIPSGIEKLSRGLFRGCVSIKEIKLQGNIKKIPVDCFKDCKQLEVISSNSEIVSVGAGAFRNCFALKDLSFLSNATNVETAAFRGCIGIEEATLRDIREIPTALFMGCSNLRSIDFPEVNNVDNYAFYGCSSLVRVPIERIKTRIGQGAFWNCISMRTPVFSETMYDIQPSAFRNCESIEEVNFPLGVRRIHAASFRGAINIRSVFIPETTDEIHKSAFRGCESLEVVDIASPELTIERTAFAGCKELYYFNFSGRLRVQQTAFENTPIESTLMSDDRVEWKSISARTASLDPVGKCPASMTVH